MIYTISFDLFIDSDEIFSDDQIKDFLRERLGGSAVSFIDVNRIEVND